MPYKLIMLLCWMVFASQAFTQEISNIRVEYYSADEYYIITYDLSGNKGGAYYLRVIPHQGDTRLENVKAVFGAGIKAPVSEKKDLKLYWFHFLDDAATGDWQFDIKAKATEWAFVEGGSFMMGNKKGWSNEKPVHSVTVSSFFIGKYEVSQNEWKRVMDQDPSYSEESGDLPVRKVSWYNAIEYCNKRSIQEGLNPCYSGSGSSIQCNWNANGYRLPTEAEWEFAARGGIHSKGNEYSGFDDKYGWLLNLIPVVSFLSPSGFNKGNELGIYYMSGGLWEWVWDSLVSYSKEKQVDPRSKYHSQERVIRGGSGKQRAYTWSVSYRDHTDANDKYSNLGFRVCRSAY
ncbi:MAG: SUMF1/EgtB/PvdO family nonheme iron enzyme [Candidatus Cloacimonetes bacterium]|nr:SUMF1/EgtB/PvdO family nonheme iron enzyme [Candidatus Cloacimonadota bacterium]